MKKIFFLLCTMCITTTLYAQQDTSHYTNHYFNIQANQLLRQLINLGGSGQNVTNPFLINYSFNKKETGIGMNIGWGFEIDNIKDGDEFNERESKIREFFFRVGFDKKFDLNKRWLMGWGIDLLRQDVSNKTTNTFDNGDGQEESIDTENFVKGWGFGPRITLAYKLGDRILLGTEASYYFIHRNITSKVEQDGGSDDEVERNTDSIELLLPSVLYLTFAF